MFTSKLVKERERERQEGKKKKKTKICRKKNWKPSGMVKKKKKKTCKRPR